MGFHGGIDAGQSSRLVVEETTDEPSFVNPNETATKVFNMNVEMENDEHE